jgi:hypothetical protein
LEGEDRSLSSAIGAETDGLIGNGLAGNGLVDKGLTYSGLAGTGLGKTARGGTRVTDRDGTTIGDGIDAVGT